MDAEIPLTLSWSCPSCAAALTVPVALAGVTGPCPNCAQTITAPTPAPANVIPFTPPLEPPVEAIQPSAVPPLPEPPPLDEPRAVTPPKIVVPTPTMPKGESNVVIWVAMLCLIGFASYTFMAPTKPTPVATRMPKASPIAQATSIAPAKGTQSAGERLTEEALHSSSTFGESLRRHHETIKATNRRYSELQHELSDLLDQQDAVPSGSAAFDRLQVQVEAKEREIEAAAK